MADQKFDTELAFALWTFVGRQMRERKTEMTAPYDAMKAWHLWRKFRHLEQPDGTNPALDAEYEKVLESTQFRGEPWVEYARFVDEMLHVYLEKFFANPAAWSHGVGGDDPVEF
ncbi:hypothetical protein [Hyphomicrobium sp. ghe19]|uniref:hypothetical protein n=1 Tax=Hyphomicrobium sp. ghe19 TaxID=2682968 RepID=UPI0013676406|nr:hypothetical protein HYPP_02434 [Hyphomicrobium sp. ghe19]